MPTLRQVLYQIYVNFTLQMQVDRSKKNTLSKDNEYLYLVGYLNALHGVGKIPEGVEALTVASALLSIYEETGDLQMYSRIDAAMGADKWEAWPILVELG